MAALGNCCLATAAAGTAVEQLFAADMAGNQLGQRLLRQRMHRMCAMVIRDRNTYRAQPSPA